MKKPFHIHIAPEVLEDLKARLAATRWIHELDNEDWKTGTNKAYLQEVCSYWHNDFDWHKQEVTLNAFNHYTTEIDDQELHFIHEIGKGSIRVPILLTHGYPDSFVRFLKLIPLLTEPDKDGLSFDVVVPSIPGYGFSSIPQEKGMNLKKIAGLFAQLMTKELAYGTFVAHGGDWGGSITEHLALYHDDHLRGIHLTDIPFMHMLEEIDGLSAAEKKFLEKMQQWQQAEGAYAMIQSTKPQTLAYGLNDSPAGLAAWLLEKFYTWSDHDGHFEDVFTKDEFLTNTTIYWATQTINSAFRLYHEALLSMLQAKYNPLVKLNPFDKTGGKTKVPAGFALFPKDISDVPKEFVERFFNVHRWTVMKSGGHFAAMEQPHALAQDIRGFVKQVYSL